MTTKTENETILMLIVLMVAIIIQCANGNRKNIIKHGISQQGYSAIIDIKQIIRDKHSVQKLGYSKYEDFGFRSLQFPSNDVIPSVNNKNNQLATHNQLIKPTAVYSANKDTQFEAPPEPDAARNLTQLITSQGYPVEVYVVQTQDGFLLDLHRIPHGRLTNNDNNKYNNSNNNNNNNNNAFDKYGTKRMSHFTDEYSHYENRKPRLTSKPPIFLQHGYLSSACDFVMNFANDSLAFILADAGYDVWMGNSRGNTYSKRHITLNENDPKFWDWSFDEMAEYDTPAFIDFILNKTSYPSLNYIGHSQGTIVAFGLLSQKPEYQRKIRLFIGLAPIISLTYMTSPMRYMAAMNESLIYHLLGHNECFAASNKSNRMATTVCAEPLTRWLCYDMLFLTNGPDLSNLNKTRLPVYMSHTPAGTSVKNLVHYAQMIREKRFAKYDYGSKSENMKRYGQPIPPAYNVSSIQVPTLLYTAGKDWLADPTDVAILESTLPNIRDKYNYPSWNHFDFVLGTGAAHGCYSEILKRLPEF